MRRTGGVWATAGLVALALVAGLLAVAALRGTSGGEPRPRASALVGDEPTPTMTRDSGLPDSEQVRDALPDTVEPPLVAVSADVAYRGRTGTCLGGAGLEASDDGGDAWRGLEVPAEAVVLLRAASESEITVIGADEQCRLRQWSSLDGGVTWGSPAPVVGVFARRPDTPRELATPNGVAKNPCPDRDVAPLSVESISSVDGAVLCTGGEVLLTSDGGASWQTKTPLPGAQALAFEGPELGWALVRDSGQCPGYQLARTGDAGTSWSTGGCLAEEPIVDARVLPSLSFSDPNRGMADVAGTVYVTRDSGYTWRLAR